MERLQDPSQGSGRAQLLAEPPLQAVPATLALPAGGGAGAGAQCGRD